MNVKNLRNLLISLPIFHEDRFYLHFNPFQHSSYITLCYTQESLIDVANMLLILCLFNYFVIAYVNQLLYRSFSSFLGCLDNNNPFIIYDTIIV